MLGRGNGGRIILLGDGTEIHTGGADDDGDVDMADRGEAEELEDSDLSEQVRKGQQQASSEGGKGEDGQKQERSSGQATHSVEEVKSPMSPPQQQQQSTPISSAMSSGTAGGAPTEGPAAEPKMSVPVEGADNKKLHEETPSASK